MDKKDNVSEPKKQRPKDYHCTICGKNFVEDSFYNSNSILTEGNNRKLWVCKKCLINTYNGLVEKYDDPIYSIFRICQLFDFYFDKSLAVSIENQAMQTNVNAIQFYIMKINSLPQYYAKTFIDSSIQDYKVKESMTAAEYDELGEEDIRNMNEMIGHIKYDPFKNENIKDRPYLYNTILNYLDENTIKDSFKLSTIIEIVKMFCQMNSINAAVNELIADPSNIEQQSGKLKQFSQIKKDLSSNIINFAKNNGIVTGGKDGGGSSSTLSGIIKDLRNKKIYLSDTDYIDIKTTEAYKAVANISSKSIIEQLMLDENDYHEMMIDAQKYIRDLVDKIDVLEKRLQQTSLENHLLKKEMEKKGFEVEIL